MHSPKPIALKSLALTFVLSSSALAQEIIPLWSSAPPGLSNVSRPERLIERPPDSLRGPITRISDIIRPTLTFYPADSAKRTGAAVLVFPGGGYQYLAVDIEGSDICQWLSSNGVACGVVKYRVPQVRSAGPPLQPLQDAQRAIRVLRSRAQKFNIDVAKIGVMGFSAGGHVAARLSKHYAENTYQPSDGIDKVAARPDFALLIYPAYLVTDSSPRKVTADVEPTRETPPTFLVQTDDDGVGVANSREYYKALIAAGVPAEFHEYPKGGHGYGMRPHANAITTVWPAVALKWINERGAEARRTTFANPLDLDYRFMPSLPSRRAAADPTMVLYRGDYYLFATSSGGYWYSPDMRSWTLVVPKGLPIEDAAPTVLEMNGKLYFTAHKSKALFTTDDPKVGEWRKVADLGSYADPMLFQDDDGRVYLYNGSSLNGGITVDELDPKNDFKVIRGPIEVMHADYANHGFERSGPTNLGAPMTEGFRIAPYVEGSWMTKHNGIYYLQYAAPGTVWKTYADGVYTSTSPTGPFTYAPYNPFSYKPGGFVGGAGHSSTFRDKDGNYWHVVTLVISVAHKFERRIGIFPAGFDSSGAMRANTYLGDYPQFLPGVVRDPLDHNLTGWMLLSGARPATASSFLKDHPVKLAFDEDIRTQWSAESGNAGEWLQVDLGARSRINAIQVNFAEQDTKALGRDSSVYEQYTIETSDDAKRWSMLVDRRTSTVDAPHAYIQLDAPRTARFVRITNVHAAAGGRFAIRDLRIFGQGPEASPAPVSKLSVRRDSADGRNATLTWAPSARARTYVIRYGLSPNTLYSSYEVGPDSTLELHSLNRGVPYYFTVDAVNAHGVTPGKMVVRAP